MDYLAKSVLLLVVALFVGCGSHKLNLEDDITDVHLVFMNHLDVGYSLDKDPGYVASVLNAYFTEYFPRAINVSKVLEGIEYRERLIYTTHPWLVSLYLDCPPNLVLSGRKVQCPSERDVGLFEAAVRQGDITWHAGPMNMEMEMMDGMMTEFAIQLGIDLDKRFGIDRKHRTLSQRDVPGTTQAVIPVLEKMGVEAISIGVNAATLPADLPSVFNWKFQNSSVLFMFHPGGYPNRYGPYPFMPGGLTPKDCHIVPGFTHALCFAFRNDNDGPPMDYNEVLAVYEVARSKFPNAVVRASTFEAFTAELQTVKDKLPVVTQEIGDVWIQGSGSDPKKCGQMRELYRLRTECFQKGECSLSDPRVYHSSRYLLKLAEHTWGLSGNCVDNIHWNNQQFIKMLQDPKGRFMNATNSWAEQREFVLLAIDALGNHSLAKQMKQRLTELESFKLDLTGYELFQGNMFQCGGFTFGFDEEGSLVKLTDPNKREWAAPDHPMAKYVYRTYNESDFDKFFAATTPFSKHFFLGIGKPNMSKNASPKSKMWPTELHSMYVNKDKCSVVTELFMKDMEELLYYGAPKVVWSNYTVGSQGSVPGVDVTVTWDKKSPTRLPEQMAVLFSPPAVSGYKWWMNKIEELVDPLNVVTNGSQYLHAVNRGVYYVDSAMKGLEIVSADTGLVQVMTPDSELTAIPFPSPPLQQVSGMAFNLYNNVWETNYIFWYPYRPSDVSESYRFRLNMNT